MEKRRDMKGKAETIKDCMETFGVTDTDQLTDEMVVCMMSLITEPSFGGASTIYEESNEEERKQFIADSKRCIEGDSDIEFYMVNREGVKTDGNEGYFDWTSRHSVWYRVIATR